MQLELSKFNTSYYSLLANTVFAIYIPKIANLIQILCIVCRALGCFKGGSCEGLRLMSYKLVLHTGPDLTDARP